MANIYAGPSVVYGSGSGTEGNPFHIKEALENLNATDKTVIMLDGTYNVGSIFNNNQNLWTLPTSEGNRQTVQAESDGGVIWKPAGGEALRFKQVCKYITFKDIIFDFINMTGTDVNGIHIHEQESPGNIHNIIWDNCTFRYAPRHNMYMGPTSHDCSYINCTSYDAGRSTTGSLWNNLYWEGYSHIVRGNLMYYTEDWRGTGLYGYQGGHFRLSTNAVNVTGSLAAPQSDGHLIEDNECRGGNIGLVVSFDDHIVRNNVFSNHRFGTSNFAIEYLVIAGTRAVDSQPCTNDGSVFYNNTMYNSTTAAKGLAFVTFSSGTATNAKSKNNIARNYSTAFDYDGATVDTATNITTDPTFTDPENFDFHIGSGGNADGTGTDLSATGFSDDKDGLARPQDGANWCIGAFEVPAPPTSSPVNTMTWPSTGVTDEELSVTHCSVTDADDDLTGDADDNAGVWFRNDVGATFSGTSTGTGTFQGEA